MTTTIDTDTQTAIQNNHPEVLRLIIFGEVGVGKSKLICQLYEMTSDDDKLRIWRLFFDNDRYPDPPVSKSTRKAVTQNAKIYPIKIGNKDALLVDTPGLGAKEDDSYRILCGIEVMVELIGAFDAVLYATKTTDRDRMGGKVMIEILKDVFEQKDETKNLSDSVIIVGTHKDQAISSIGDNIDDDVDDDEYCRLVADYTSGKSKEILTELSKKWQDGGVDGLQHIAFVTSVSNKRQNVEVDVDELNTKIISLCEGNKLTYSHPTPKQMAQFLRICGWNPNATEEDYIEARELMKQWMIKTFINTTAVAGTVAGTVTGTIVVAAAGTVAVTGTVAIAPAIAPVIAAAVAGGAIAAAVTGTGTIVVAAASAVTEALQMPEALPKSLIERSRISPPESNSDEWSICALLSGLAYHVKTKDELKSALDYSKIEVKHYNRHPADPTEEGNCEDGDREADLPVLSIIVGDKMYIAWRGSGEISDFITDLNANVVASDFWHESFPNIGVHSGMHSIMHDQFVRGLQKRVLSLVNDHDIKEIIFTGHSLGGGIAQIALMAVMGLLKGKKSHEEYSGLSEVKVTCKAFAAPMVFHYKEGGLTFEETEAISEFKNNAIIWVYDQDPVPRMPGHIDFWQPAVRHIIKQGGMSSEGKDYVSRESYLCLPLKGTPTDTSSNNPFSGFCIKQGLLYGCDKAITNMNMDDTLVSTMKDYKHIAQLYLVKSKVEDASKEILIFNNKDLLNLPFEKKDAENNLVESHLVTPHCVGSYQYRRLEKVGRFF